jgi:hypothetical protein
VALALDMASQFGGDKLALNKGAKAARQGRTLTVKSASIQGTSRYIPIWSRSKLGWVSR